MRYDCRVGRLMILRWIMFLFVFFFFKQKTAYEMQRGLVGSEMCIRDRYQRRVHGMGPPDDSNIMYSVYMYNQASTSAAFNALNKSVLSISQMEAASSSCYFSRKSDNESEIELSMVLESAIERELMPNLSLIHI
eukprot:TRINITY_DN14365_c0_g1_i2.p1 TRINITY_DN14365_c0_g1~~TRINITY_DN14365_c0_g1_i2.p1  ORF type:complete len:135 (+),score=32.40 TRINITY_DN14365_c0_g1_i2:12-416(+)